MKLALLGIGLGVCLGVSSCGTTCDRDVEEEIRYEGGSVDSTGSVFESSPWEGPYLHFPTGRRYVLVHGLGRRPAAVHTYVAFQDRPMPANDEARNSDHTNVAESAGNQVVIEVVNDEVITVRNDTCVEFYLRVVAVAAPATEIAGAEQGSPASR